jgi:diguanylate cyclase (GGDEF)-like protein
MTARMPSHFLQSEQTLERVPARYGDRELPNPPTVLQLVRPLAPETLHSTCLQALERFHKDSGIFALPIVDAEGIPAAILARQQFLEFFSKHYSREIFGRRNIADLLKSEAYRTIPPVVVEDTCSVDDVARIILDAGMQHLVTGFIVCSEGRYAGIADGRDLLDVITQRKQEELYYLANYDYLTGIPNRLLLGDRLEHACREAERNGKSVGLLFIDVDRFKQINDSFGHRTGDAVLCKVVERLKMSARRCDTIARLSGDEFVILMGDLDESTAMDQVAQRVLDAMHAPIEVAGHALRVSVSIGGAAFPEDDFAMSPLLAKADAAMYEAKAGGRNGYRRYSASTGSYNPVRLSLEHDLRRAIESDELLLVYQPQLGLPSRQLRGIETLVRWRHPERGLISPAHFIPLAEESGLIVQLGEWVIANAFKQMREWKRTGYPCMRMSINISALQLRKGNLPRFLDAQLAACGIDPGCVELELTESMLMGDLDGTLQTLQEIKSLGVKLAIDDFGTGFSSLSYLRRFPIDRLKIDQSFIRDIDVTPTNESIARAIVALAKSLNLETIAEGVESASEQALLANIGCDEGQGYLYGKPMTANDLALWLGANCRETRIADPIVSRIDNGCASRMREVPA